MGVSVGVRVGKNLGHEAHQEDAEHSKRTPLIIFKYPPSTHIA